MAMPARAEVVPEGEAMVAKEDDQEEMDRGGGGGDDGEQDEEEEEGIAEKSAGAAAPTVTQASIAAKMKMRTIFRPPSGCTLLDHATSPKMEYRDRSHKEMEKAVQVPDLKCILNDVNFLTEKSRAGDTVVYAGNNIGPWLGTVARMFPTLHFLVYDGNAAKLNKELDAGRLPPNIHLKNAWFSVSEGARYNQLGTGYFSPTNALMIAETVHLTWDKNSPDGCQSTPIVRDLDRDLANQDAWVQSLRPRSAMVKFCIPYQGGKNYSYLKGQMHLEPFAAKTSTEVRLVVDSPPPSLSGAYPRTLYNATTHDQCLFYHNSVTRLQHADSECRIKVSWDQHAAHNILERWGDRAMLDHQLTGIEMTSDKDQATMSLRSRKGVQDARRQFVKERINALDMQFGRTLGCRMSALLCPHVEQDNHVKRNEVGWVKFQGRWMIRTKPSKKMLREQREREMMMTQMSGSNNGCQGDGAKPMLLQVPGGEEGGCEMME